MLVIPAIDLKENKTVRLYKGNFNQVSYYDEEAEETARTYIDSGAKRLHIVLLWGAKEGKISEQENKKIEQILKVRNASGKENCKIQLGGGIRKYSQIEYFLQKELNYFIMGTSLLIPIIMESGFSLTDLKLFYQRGGKKFNPDEEVPEFELIDKLDNKLKKKIIVAIDYRKDEIGLSGWEVTVPLLPEYTIKKFTEKGFNKFLLTDIERDGTLEGIEKESLFRIMDKISELNVENIEILTAGGITSEQDIELIANYKHPPTGVVIGKALYQKRMDLKQLIQKFQN